ncbi:hypothetical protein CYMTET_53696 [Cymbomonas tetramitiformis]|uniref:Uncharacterized protein n=1 Tax=Cymbomonas tetramitiformis TaxID=36881 RepID=A0AAE0BHU9_9CHLO|nr:hypothetical protein CYMTET_53696 [Cymbomonas tetramitiformis]
MNSTCAHLQYQSEQGAVATKQKSDFLGAVLKGYRDKIAASGIRMRKFAPQAWFTEEEEEEEGEDGEEEEGATDGDGAGGGSGPGSVTLMACDSGEAADGSLGGAVRTLRRKGARDGGGAGGRSGQGSVTPMVCDSGEAADDGLGGAVTTMGTSDGGAEIILPSECCIWCKEHLRFGAIESKTCATCQTTCHDMCAGQPECPKCLPSGQGNPLPTVAARILTRLGGAGSVTPMACDSGEAADGSLGGAVRTLRHEGATDGGGAGGGSGESAGSHSAVDS